MVTLGGPITFREIKDFVFRSRILRHRPGIITGSDLFWSRKTLVYPEKKKRLPGEFFMAFAKLPRAPGSLNQSSSCISLIHFPLALRMLSFQFSGVPRV